MDGLREKLRESFRKEVREEGRAVAELTSTLDKPCVNAHGSLFFDFAVKYA